MSVFEAPRALAHSDSFGGFDCGVALVNDWAAARAHCAQKSGTARVYISCCDGRIAGFYSLSSHSVAREQVRGGWPRRNVPEQIPAILLGMLGVDRRFAGMHLGVSVKIAA